MAKKVMIIGLDCAEPSLVFDRWRDELPNIDRLMSGGVWGPLESAIPAITCPAWMSMLTSKTPGHLGFYGFRNREDHSYDNMSFALSHKVQDDTVWDVLGRHDRSSIVIGVPQTFPPKPLQGHLISSFLTPSTEQSFTYPESLRDEVFDLVGDYMVDVTNFRSADRDRILDEIYEMTAQRFDVADHLLGEKPWEFFIMVEMGVDRVHHAYWQYMDPEHVLYEPDSPYGDAIREYYHYVDERIGDLLQHADDDTLVMVVSDHGAKRMDGGVFINEWLRREGYLALEEEPSEPTRIADAGIDWERTRAWGFGGYYGRLFFNVRGREPRGTVDPDELPALRREIKDRLEAMTGPGGKPLGTRVFLPEEIYGECRNIPPDLIIYFGDLYWRSLGSVGTGELFSRRNDTGPDGANHAQHGIFIMNRGRRLDLPEASAGGLLGSLFDGLAGGSDDAGQGPPARGEGGLAGERRSGLHLMDVAPTVLEHLNVPVPDDMLGTVVETDWT